MKGLTMVSPGKIGWVEKDIPKIGSKDVLLKPLAVAMCSSDIHSVELGIVTPDMFLGHEALAEVVEVGSEVKDFKVGDKVMVPSTSPNWLTPECQKGLHQHSSQMFGGIRFSSLQDGCFGEYFLGIQADMNLCKIPEWMDKDTALMTVDMVTTGFQGAEMADIKFGDTVVVFGTGPVGIMCIAGARLKGAGKIIAIGTRPKCVELAKEFGANEVVTYKNGTEKLVESIYALTDGKGADKCIVAGGENDSIGAAVSMIKPGGIVSNVNYFASLDPLPIPTLSFGMGMAQKTITGGICAGGRVRMESLCELIKYSGINPGKLVTHKFHGFNELEEAFKLMEEKPDDLVKPIVILEDF